ncbi:MAG: TRAP transporter small permease subunit [Treponema sp.]|jgi:TRAP-type C4-dicarboxylate transport system permease small subunit|nr:TRAP transporter small permease subunit [Treponema sp.]
MKILAKISDVYIKILKIYLEVLLALMVVCIIIQVFCRFVLFSPLAWSEELTTLLQAALIFPGIAYCVKNKTHIEMTAVYERLPRNGKIIFDAIAQVVLVICGFYFIWSVKLFLGVQKQTALTMTWLRLDVFYQVLFWGALTTELYLISDFLRFIRFLFVKEAAK